MTGREAPSWGMPLLFSIQGGNEFLVIFQKGCPRAQASPLPGDRNRRERVSWCDDEHFFFFSPPFLMVGLALRRFGRGPSLPSEPSSSSPRTYCVDIWCSRWSAMKNSRQPALSARRNFSTIGLHLWCIQPNLELMYIGGGVASVQWRAYLSCNELQKQQQLTDTFAAKDHVFHPKLFR